MLKFRKALLSNTLYLLIVIVAISALIIRFELDKNSFYKRDDKVFEGILSSYYIDGNYLQMNIKAKDRLIINYYFKTKEEKESFSNVYKLGNSIIIEGEVKKTKKLDLKNSFDYEKYLKRKGIAYLINANKITLKNHKQKYLYRLKDKLLKHLDKSINYKYLRNFIIGDSSYLDKEIKTAYQNIGINHLLAISGTHVSIISNFSLKVLKRLKFKEFSRYLISFIFLFIALYFTSFTPVFLASVMFFLLRFINKYYYFHISMIKLFILNISLMTLINKFIIFDIGFLYYASISIYLILNTETLNKSKGIKNILITSFYANLAALPLSINLNYSINILSALYNLFYILYVSFIVFPLLIINAVFLNLDKLVRPFLSFLEYLSLLLKTIPSEFIFAKLPIIIIIIYYLIIFLYSKYKKLIYLLLFLLLIHSNIKTDAKNYISFLDVGQADSTLIRYDNRYYLIDCGGKELFNKEKWSIRENASDFGESVLLPFLKSQGIKKIDYLFITHGHSDHMGGAFALVKNLKIGRVFLNNNHLNEEEKELVKLLKERKITYQKLAYNSVLKRKELKIQNYGKSFLDENQSSMILLVEIKDQIKIAIMGDAYQSEEKSLLGNEKFKNLDILKLGHHGSKTSSSDEFIKHTNPKIAVVSSGENNLFAHPHPEVIARIKKQKSKIHETAKSGSLSLILP